MHISQAHPFPESIHVYRQRLVIPQFPFLFRLQTSMEYCVHAQRFFLTNRQLLFPKTLQLVS